MSSPHREIRRHANKGSLNSAAYLEPQDISPEFAAHLVGKVMTGEWASAFGHNRDWWCEVINDHIAGIQPAVFSILLGASARSADQIEAREALAKSIAVTVNNEVHELDEEELLSQRLEQ